MNNLVIQLLTVCLLSVCLFTNSSYGQTSTPPLEQSEITLDFDETDIRNLNLDLKWNFQSKSNKRPTRFVLLMEIKRLNFSTFLFDYSSPQLIDDETIVKASVMEPDNFKNRVELSYVSSIDCSLNCINSTRHDKTKVFDCNIFYYEPTTKTCVLYEYDFDTKPSATPQSIVARKKKSSLKQNFELDDMYESFKEECDMDEILGDVIGYSKLCRRILEYKNTHLVKINPYIDYRFSISIRDENNKWTPFMRKEYQYSPKISIEVKGELKLGSNLTLECLTELSPSIVDSITWKNNNPALKGVMTLAPLTVSNLHQTFFCEIRFNYFRMIQKAYRLNLTSLGDLKPVLAMKYNADVENLNVNINWNISAPAGSPFTPEKIILLYSENNQPYKFVNKYLLFELSKYDNVPLRGARDFEEMVTINEDECALNCLQKSFCDHFVFIKSIEPSKISKRKNCQLAANTNNNFFPCRYDLTCANLSPYKKHIQNDSVNILILPNITYKFKLQLKDKHLNWTDIEETEPIFLPLKMSVELKNEVNTNGEGETFRLICNTNINKNIQHKISWIKDDKELSAETALYKQTVSGEVAHANSVLEFNWRSNRTFNFDGVYKCKIHIRYPEVGQGTFYASEPRNVKFVISDPLIYETLASNLTLPTIPGLILEISCQVSGTPIKSLKWLIDGINYNDKKLIQIATEPFVVSLEDKNSSLVNNLLVLRIDGPKAPSKYECILNDNITVRSHFIEIIEQKPEYNIQVDTSNLNKLQVSIEIKEKPNKNFEQFRYLNFETKPLKFAILYVENTTFDMAYQTFIAPETLSKSNPKDMSKLEDRILLGTLKSTQHAIQSCKILCFNTPFCTSYEYLMYDDSCRLYSNKRVNSYYKNLISGLNQTLDFKDFNLMHLLQLDFVHLLQEENTFNTTILTDNKIYLSCEPKTSEATLSEELHCVDELADFSDKYVFENLKPMTSYQFRIEIINTFGKSTTYYTPQIDVPFSLNPIMEKYAMKNSKDFYSLECSTPLTNIENLHFVWYKNGHVIMANDTRDYEQFQREPTNENRAFSNELVFKQEARSMHAAYTCSLVYTDDFLHLEKNVSYVFISKMSPTFAVYNNTVHTIRENDDWSDSCAVEAWPLPSVQWFFNNRPVSNKTDSLVPFSRNHHTKMTMMTSNLLVPNANRASAGKYVCMLNGQIAVKNVTLRVAPSSDSPDKSKSDSSIDDNMDRTSTSSGGSVMSVILTLTLIAIISFAAFSAFVYLKRKRVKLSTLLTYNRLDEELVSGVDNLNLTDEN